MIIAEQELNRIISENAELKRRIERERVACGMLKDEVAAWRDLHPEEKWHPPNGHHQGMFTYNDAPLYGEDEFQ